MFISHDDIEYLPPAPAPAAPKQARLGGDATTATPAFFSTAQDLLNAAQQTNDYITAMSAAVASVKDWSKRGVPAGAGAAFDAFRKSWSDFYTTELSSRARVLAFWLTSNLQGSIVNFQQQAADWGKKLKKWGLKIEATAPEAASSGGSKTLMYIGIGTVVVIGLFVVGKLIHTVALGEARDGELKEAEDEAMRIADEKARQKRLRSISK